MLCSSREVENMNENEDYCLLFGMLLHYWLLIRSRSGCYEIITKSKKGNPNKTNINYNFARLYCKEPVNITESQSPDYVLKTKH